MKNIFNKQLLRNEVLHLVVLALVVGAGSYLLYNNQHNRVVDLTSKNSKLSTFNNAQTHKLAALKSTTDDLTKKNTVLQNQLDAYKKSSSVKIPQPTYALKINSVKQYWTPAYFADHTYNILVLDVSITNSGNAAGYVSPSDFTVKDSDSVSQQTTDAVFHQNIYVPAPQPAELSGQTLDAKDTVRGSLMYYTLTSKTNFTLKYDGQSYPVTVNGQINL